MNAPTWWPDPIGPTRVIVPLVAGTVEEAEQQARAAAQSDADLVEWRADTLGVPLQAATLAVIADGLRELVAPKPLLFTWRSGDEGGLAAPEADDDYAAIVGAVVQARTANLVDVQVRHPAARGLFATARDRKLPVVGSWHDTAATPPVVQIVDALQQAESMGAAVAKVAVTPHDQADVVTLLLASVRAIDALSRPFITVSMGDAGLISRVFAGWFGSDATFASLGTPSAPGQISLTALQEMWAQLP